METNYNGHSNKSGIYQIRNLNNGRVYVGSAKLFSGRCHQHLYSLRRGTHHNKYLQHDFNKCGEEAFVFEVLEVVQSSKQEDRLIVEQQHIDKHNDKQTCYNLRKEVVTASDFCYTKTPTETFSRKSKATKAAWLNHQRKLDHVVFMKTWWSNDENKKRMVNKFKGRACSEKAKAIRSKLSKENVGSKNPRYGCTHSLETKMKQSIGRSVAVYQFDKLGSFIMEHVSAKEAQATTKVHRSAISCCCNGKRQFAGGFRWSFVMPTVPLQC